MIGRTPSKCARSERDHLAESDRIRSRCTWSGIRSHQLPHREWLEWKWTLALLNSFVRILVLVRYAYILRTTLLFCSIGPALFRPHCLLALNQDSPIDDTLRHTGNLGFEPALSPCMHSPDALCIHTVEYEK